MFVSASTRRCNRRSASLCVVLRRSVSLCHSASLCVVLRRSASLCIALHRSVSLCHSASLCVTLRRSASLCIALRRPASPPPSPSRNDVVIKGRCSLPATSTLLGARPFRVSSLRPICAVVMQSWRCRRSAVGRPSSAAGPQSGAQVSATSGSRLPSRAAP